MAMVMTGRERIALAVVAAMLTAMALGLAGGQGAVRAAAAPMPAGAPKRIVSINLCSDQLLLAVADRHQIAGITRFATQPAMSAEAGAARGLPMIGQGAEALAAMDPDLVMGMPATGSPMLTAIGPRSIRTLDLDWAASLSDIRAQLREVATAVGHPQRAEVTLAAMDAILDRVGQPGRGRVGAYYQRRGYLTGTETLVDDMLGRVGLVNLARRLGKPPLAAVSLEEMVAARPDFIIMEAATAHVADQGTEMLHHPALRDVPRIYVPEAWTVCGGPAYARAVETIAHQIEAIDAGADRHKVARGVSR